MWPLVDFERGFLKKLFLKAFSLGGILINGKKVRLTQRTSEIFFTCMSFLQLKSYGCITGPLS